MLNTSKADLLAQIGIAGEIHEATGLRGTICAVITRSIWNGTLIDLTWLEDGGTKTEEVQVSHIDNLDKPGEAVVHFRNWGRAESQVIRLGQVVNAVSEDES